jgi:nicotinamidase-related amidase
MTTNACTALLGMDLQNGLLPRIADAATLVDTTNRAVDLVRDRGGVIGWVRIALDADELAAIPATSTMAGRAHAGMHPDAPATQVGADLRAVPQDISVRKIRVGAFTTTDLDAQLRARGVDTLVLAGISTSGVVLSTVREAMDRDYRIIVLRDACADPDPEVHAFLVDRIFPRQTTVVDVAGLAAVLG